MTFFNGNTDLDTLLNLWVNELIATGSWVDNDVALVGNVRSIRHAVDAGVFIQFKRTNSTLNNSANTVSRQFLEIQVIFSSGWDGVGHLPTGTLRYTGIPVASGTAENAARTGQHWTWVDANGFSSVFRPTTGAGFDMTSFCSLQRITTKEYADGATNIYWCGANNNHEGVNRNYYGNYAAVDLAHMHYRYGFVHPFTYAQGSDAIVGLGAFSVNCHNGTESWFASYRSPGNSKVYFAFPYFFNAPGVGGATQRNPITVGGDQWFRGSQALGIADGDIVDYTAPGPILKRYLIKNLDSPDSTAAIEVGIRFA